MSTGVEFFVSYARKDKASERLVAELKYRLPRAGHEVSADTDIDPGARWNEELDRQIDACDAFVILLSAKALRSKYVGLELERARKRNEAAGRPIIIPIRVNHSRSRSLGDFERILSPVEQLEWESKDDTPLLVLRIEDAIANLEQHATSPIVVAPEEPPPRTIPKALLISSAVLIAILLVAAAMTFRDLRKLSGEIPETEVRATYSRLRAAQAWLIPRLWLWNRPQQTAQSYWMRRGDGIADRAKPKLASRRTRIIDEGLILAALAALKSDAPAANDARDRYHRLNYEQLVSTLRFPERVQGEALAVYSASNRVSLADGPHVFRCTPNWSCDQTTLSIDAAHAAAFVSETRLVTVSPEGRADQWDLSAFRTPGSSTIEHDGSATDVATSNGDLVIAFDAAPFLFFDVASATPPRQPNVGPIKRVTFGPCAPCVTLLSDGGRATIWDYVAGRRFELGTDAVEIAATRRGGAISIAWTDGSIQFFDANGSETTPRFPSAFESIESMAISDTGRSVAIVHDGIVSVIDSDRTPAGPALVRAEIRPSSTTVTWLSNAVITRSPEELRVWNPSAPSVQRDVAPRDRWREWRKQLGLTVDASGEVVIGAAGSPQLGWNRAQQRIEEQQ